MNKADATFVYLIAEKRDGCFVGPVKVGVSDGPLNRLATIQTGNPLDLGIVGLIAYPNRDIALSMEDCFHVTQKNKRLRGEWFDMDPADALALARLHLRFGLTMFASELTEDQHNEAVQMAEAYL